MDVSSQAGFAISSHTVVALVAVLLGFFQLVLAKGTARHRILGYLWALAMMWIAASSFWINDLRVIGAWSPIHLLSIFVLVSVPVAVWRAHVKDVDRHKASMTSIYFFALLVAGILTLLPGRLMHRLILGGGPFQSDPGVQHTACSASRCEVG